MRTGERTIRSITMATFAEQITGLTLPTMPTLDPAEAPRIWWHNGDRKSKSPGDFYTKQDEFAAGLGGPWSSDGRFDGEVGFSTRTLRIAPLAWRSQPFRDAKDATGRRDRSVPRAWFLRWEQGMQLYTEVLCLIEGYDGPVIWCSDGLTGKAVSGKGGILKAYQGGLLAEASRVAGRQMPPWAFWLPIASKLAGDKVAYEDTGYGSFVTPPALHLPESPLDTLFVGPDVIARGAEILNTSHRDWATTIPPHRMPGNVVTGEVVNAPQLPAGRNVPQLVSGDDDTY
jgi:hypothetical protein